ncbi:MAG: efflux RND transporter periplasmic adaptor subunit [Fidelibacterota bacterium]
MLAHKKILRIIMDEKLKMTFISALYVLIFLISCSSGDKDNELKVQRIIPVKVMEVKSTVFHDILRSMGQINSQKRVKLDFQVPGRIKRIYFDEGDYVLKGKVISELERTDYEARFLQAEAAYQKAEIDLKNTRELFNRNSVSREVLRQAELAYKSARSSYILSKSALDHTRIIAPFSGYIIARNVEESELYNPSVPSAPAFVLADLENLEVIVSIPESDIGRVKEGLHARIRVKSFPEINFDGAISKVGFASSDRTNVFNAWILLRNRDLMLKLGMVADVEIILHKYEDALVLPLDAILEENAEKYVYVVKDDTASKRIVNIKSIEKGKALVSGGINSGDMVVIMGQRDLSEGSRVSIER